MFSDSLTDNFVHILYMLMYEIHEFHVSILFVCVSVFTLLGCEPCGTQALSYTLGEKPMLGDCRCPARQCFHRRDSKSNATPSWEHYVGVEQPWNNPEDC